MASEGIVHKVSVSCGGVFLALLALMLIYLKLIEVIDWSWWWVLAPLWIPFVGGLLLGMVGLVIILVIAAIQAESDR